MRLTAEQKRRQWEMRTERLVKLISLRATPSIVVFECRLVIGSYGWRRFWWEIIKYKLDNFKRKWWKSAETKAFEKQMEEWDNERDGQQG